MDFRLGFGASLRRGDRDRAPRRRRAAAARTRGRSRPSCYGALPATLAALREGAGGGQRHRPRGSSSCARSRSEKRAAERAELDDDRAPLHPMRVYGELGEVLDRDAIVVGDGGDFVSYAGRVIDTYEPGCWMDPGPFGCLGAGPG